MILLEMAIRFANLFLAALVAGATFGVWLIFNPIGLDGPAYIALQQQGIRGMNVAMPVLGLLTILATIAAAILGRDDRSQLILLAAAGCAFLAGGLITRFLNQPINAIVMTWSSSVPPAQWAALRDAWWRWHVARTLLALAGLSLLIFAALMRGAKA